MPTDFRNKVIRMREAQLLPFLPQKKNLWLIRHQGIPMGQCCYDYPYQMESFSPSISWHLGFQPQNKGIPVLRELCLVLAQLKAILGHYYCQSWRDSVFQRKPNHCQVVWKHDENHGGDPALDCQMFPPSACPEGKGKREDADPLTASDPHREGLRQGWDCWLVVMACRLIWWFNGWCFKSVGSKALSFPMQSFFISRQPLV